jgi:molybdenum cofactor cytidylyltransferase
MDDKGTGSGAAETIRIALLAAGESKRFGGQKLLASLHERPLLLHALSHAQRACPGRVLLVTGHEAAAVEAASTNLADTIVRNPAYADGIGTSIAAAVRACPADADAMVIALADQPLVTAEHYRALIAAWERAEQSIVATAFADTFGPPVLFGRQHFSALAELGDDSGAKHVLMERLDSVATLEFGPAAVDIDTPEDLDRISQSASSEQTCS